MNNENDDNQNVQSSSSSSPPAPVQDGNDTLAYVTTPAWHAAFSSPSHVKTWREEARIAGSLEQQEAARLLVHNACRLTRRQCEKVLQVALTKYHRAMMEPGEVVCADWCCQDHVQYQV